MGNAKTFGILLFYSLLMFTLPFIAFFGSKQVLKDYFHVTGFAQTAWSVASAVVVVNAIAFSYVWRALVEPDNSSDEALSKEGLSETLAHHDQIDTKKRD